MSSRIATLQELQTVYGLYDAYNLLEVITVDAYNQRQVDAAIKRRDG